MKRFESGHDVACKLPHRFKDKFAGSTPDVHPGKDMGCPGFLGKSLERSHGLFRIAYDCVLGADPLERQTFP